MRPDRRHLGGSNGRAENTLLMVKRDKAQHYVAVPVAVG
jgi:hypothetical protein